MAQIVSDNIPQAFADVMSYIRVNNKAQESRNGPVLSVPDPVMLKVRLPEERMLFDPIRNANPFFHVMEFVWMMSGSQDVGWIKHFNSRMVEYADHGTLRGAYGYRWRENWQFDQIYHIIQQLKDDPDTRQAVLAMWDPSRDAPWKDSKDRPCNTHIYFRVVDGFLNMTVCNRSNDAVWGMMGANAVHMTFLQELVAEASGFAVGHYYVMTNNLHYYVDIYPQGRELLKITAAEDLYQFGDLDTYPLLRPGETYRQFVKDCEDLVFGEGRVFRTEWMNEVGEPVFHTYVKRKAGAEYAKHLEAIKAQDIQMACSQWIERMEK